MKRSAFARLCDISAMMVSKYEAKGFIIVEDNQVDVMTSLENLEGRLDETKRSNAVAAMLAATEPVLKTASRSSTPISKPKLSAKLQKDEVDLNLRKLEYGIKAGLLLHKDDVAEAGHQAIAAMREVFANSKRDLAKKLCVRFDIAADKETALARYLGEMFEEPLGTFSKLAIALATPVVPMAPEISLSASSDDRAAQSELPL